MKKITKNMAFLWLLLPLSLFAQNAVEGTVIGAMDDQPIPGVNIIVKGTANGTVTDFNGKYLLDEIKENDILVFSYVGFTSQEIPYSGNASMDVSLQEDAASLEEVVVVGYGTSLKKDLTGSVSIISSDEFNTGNNVTAENLFTGRVAGVNINTNGGPAGNSEIRIRGGASLNASNNPLIVVDGLPLNDTSDLANGSRSILSSINPSDIASFSILKDASAAAIYGNRGANGVIIITTKKGKQQLQVTFDAQTSINTATKIVDVFSANEFRNYIQENFPDKIGLLGSANTDWQDAIYTDAFSSVFNASVSGAINPNLPARISINRTDQEGLRLTSNFERTTTSLSLNPNMLGGDLKIDVNANLAFEKNRFADGVEGAAIQFDPTQPILDPTSLYGGYYEYTDAASGIVIGNVPRNPVSQLLNTRNIANVRRYYGNFKIDYRLPFFKDINAVVNMGLDNSETDRFLDRPKNSPLGFNATNGAFLGERTDTDVTSGNQLLDIYLNYQKTFGDLNLQATGGYSYQKFEFEKFETGNIRNPTIVPERTINQDVVMLAYFLRSNLSFKNKYFLKASLRRDGTSRFSKENRWGYFPALSAGWEISEEPFLKNSKIVSNLKLRAGYGITGQQDIAAAGDYLERYRLSNPNSQYFFNGQLITLAQAQYRNEAIKWEEITEYNLGLDYGFYDNRISGSIDLFRKDSNDLLSDAPIADGANFSNRGFQNIGRFVTQGLEFSISTDIIATEDLRWSLTYNTTFIDRKIKRLAFDQDIFEGDIDGGTGNRIQVQRTGFAPFGFYTFAQVYDTNGKPIEGAYADLNRDGQITEQDKYISGNGTPDVTMGLQSEFIYKNFDFNFNLRASLGNEIYNNVNASKAQQGNVFRVVLNNIPTSVVATNFVKTPDVIFSDYFVEDASFLRMDNITIGYTLKDLIKGVSSLRIWTGLQNAFVITEYSGIDPEIANNGIDKTIYPRGRTFLLGLNYKF